MKKVLVALGVVGLMAAAPGSFADGPTGTSEPRDANGNQTNQVACPPNANGGTVGPVRTGSTGTGSPHVEVCDGDNAHWDGRVIVQGNALAGRASVTYDGDATNPAPASGYLRADADQSGARVYCDDGANDQDGTTAQGPGNGSDCTN